MDRLNRWLMACAVFMFACLAQAQTFPAKPVRVLIGQPPGGVQDTLARAMAADPDAGIIQTLPLLHNRWTPFARMMQFAGRVYGPIIAAGLNAWHGRDGDRKSTRLNSSH